MNKLSSIAYYVTDKISSNDISLSEYVTTDCILQNKKGREVASNLPPQPCCLTRYQRGDILIANIRPYLKKVWFADIDGGASSDVLVFRAKEGHSPSFLYAVLLQDSFFDYVMQGAKGSKMPRGDKEQILRYEMPILSCSEESIGTFFLNLDQKIRLNEQINQNLEAMTKQLYDYWFVQFDFPNEEGKPYKSSGGAMVWNETLKRDIPEGWNDCVLGDYIGRITNGLNPRKNFVLGNGNNYYVTIRSLAGTTIDWNNCDRCDDEALAKINSRSQLQIGDIIFSAIGTIGRTYYILEEPSNWNISETSFTLRAKNNVPNDFFYGMLRSNEIQIKSDKAAMGSTLRCLVMDSLCSLLYVKVPEKIMCTFSAKVSPLYRQIHQNNKEIAELTKQRNELLPLLMNGQVSVNSDLADD
ncbi:restriction endonuclease subunit S [Bacteroides sp. 2201st1_D9_2201SCRN_220225]|uniref:restriction endonuclease subunit S n=1 Tax=Bacteroides sp. 2201st1_D9_2201SCRN_220225 TaxID=3143218 RepID=UPI0034A38E57